MFSWELWQFWWMLHCTSMTEVLLWGQTVFQELRAEPGLTYYGHQNCSGLSSGSEIQWRIPGSSLSLPESSGPSNIKMELLLPTFYFVWPNKEEHCLSFNRSSLSIETISQTHGWDHGDSPVAQMYQRCSSQQGDNNRASGCAVFYQSRYSKLFHSRKKRQRWHVGHINMLTERKSGVMVSNSIYVSCPASLAGVPTKRLYPDCAGFWTPTHTDICRTAWMELSELFLEAFFPRK